MTEFHHRGAGRSTNANSQQHHTILNFVEPGCGQTSGSMTLCESTVISGAALIHITQLLYCVNRMCIGDVCVSKHMPACTECY